MKKIFLVLQVIGMTVSIYLAFFENEMGKAIYVMIWVVYLVIDLKD
jgi:hypothetical protein